MEINCELKSFYVHSGTPFNSLNGTHLPHSPLPHIPVWFNLGGFCTSCCLCLICLLVGARQLLNGAWVFRSVLSLIVIGL